MGRDVLTWPIMVNNRFSVFYVWFRCHQRIFFWWSKYYKNLTKKLTIFLLGFSINIFRWLNVSAQPILVKNNFLFVFCIWFRAHQISFLVEQILEKSESKVGMTPYKALYSAEMNSITYLKLSGLAIKI